MIVCGPLESMIHHDNIMIRSLLTNVNNVILIYIYIYIAFQFNVNRGKKSEVPVNIHIKLKKMDNKSETQVTINKPSRVLHFSDGVDEEFEKENVTEVTSKPPEENVDPKTLTWGPWFSHVAYKSGTKVLNAVDYAGESLAGFFGITSPKYQIEISEYERVQEEQKKLEEDSAGWMPKNGGGDIPLVLNEPIKVVDKAGDVKNP